MELSQRIYYLSFIIIGIMFIIVGFALDELNLLVTVDNYGFDEWYSFLEPWIGTNDNGIPVPWEQ